MLQNQCSPLSLSLSTMHGLVEGYRPRCDHLGILYHVCIERRVVELWEVLPSIAKDHDLLEILLSSKFPCLLTPRFRWGSDQLWGNILAVSQWPRASMQTWKMLPTLRTVWPCRGLQRMVGHTLVCRHTFESLRVHIADNVCKKWVAVNTITKGCPVNQSLGLYVL